MALKKPSPGSSARKNSPSLPRATKDPLWKQIKAEGRVRPDDLHDLFGIYSPPVPVIDIVDGLGVKLYPMRDQEWSTVVNIAEGVARMWFDEKVPATKRNFNVAHALGHLLLHLSERSHHDMTFHESSPEEQEADQFALDLLIPFWMLEPYIEAATQSKARLATTARKFGVPTNTFYQRIMEALGNDAGTI